MNSHPLELQWTFGELTTGGPSGLTGGSWRMSGSGDHDGVMIVAEVVTASYDVTQWTVVLPPAAGPVAYRFPQLPPDLIALWSDRDLFNFRVMAVDTPATSYAEFRRDAAPESPWQWMRGPVAPSKVRIGKTY